MTFKIYTLGCKVNAYESQALKERLLKQGYTESTSKEADIYFVNTCAVTAEAERKDLQKVRSISNQFPNKPILIMGCSSQIHKEKYLEIPGVKAVVGNSRKECLEKYLHEEGKDFVEKDSRHFTYADTPTHIGEKNVRGYVKIQDGCDNFCSYCVVPFTRGNSRCREHTSILEEAKSLIEQGIKELVIGGIDAGCYQDPNDPSYRLTSLLKDMLHLSDKPYRIRVSSIEASQIDEEYVKLFAQHKDVLCPHFHLPLQSGSEKILKEMNRKYALSQFEEKVNLIRSYIPDVAFSSDVIAGFPGESEVEFRETYEFCKKIGFMRIHAFPYSERPFTRAAILKDSVPMRVRMDRVKELISLSEENEKRYRSSLKGKEALVLIEYKNNKGLFEGYSENYLRFEIDSKENLLNQFVKLNID